MVSTSPDIRLEVAPLTIYQQGSLRTIGKMEAIR